MSLPEKSKTSSSEYLPSTSDPNACRYGPFTATSPQVLFKELSLLDRLLTPLIIVTMIIGVVLGEFVPNIRDALDTVHFQSVSVPIAIGLIVMMWPILTKVQYEALPKIFSSSRIWVHIAISITINWLIGPFIMLGLAWATLPDQPGYRTGVIMVGIARCIAMVMIWNGLARGNNDYAAILVVINSIMQIVLYSPFAVLFINIIGGETQEGLRVSYGNVAISVLIYLGIPLIAGVITRYTVWYLTSKVFLEKRFLPIFSPLALVGLLYTILVLFAYQGHRIIHNIGPVFRVMVPLVLYFIIMWTSAFVMMQYLSRKEKKSRSEAKFGYEMAVVQSFTAASNNFELAIAVAVAVYGVNSEQALAATIGPLVEVPVLLGLTWVALYFKQKLKWTHEDETIDVVDNEPKQPIV